MHRRLFFLSVTALLIAACDQEPVGLPVTDSLDWHTLFQFEISSSGPVCGSSANDVYIVGYGPSQPELIHFDGRTWNPVPSPELHGPSLWGSGPNDLYVANIVGLLHYDGASWTDVPVEASDVTGSGPDNVYATTGGLVSHFDGSSWTEIYAGDRIATLWAGPGLSAALVPINPDPDSLQWWDGAAWTATPAPGRIYDLWGPSSDSLVAVGSNDPNDQYDASIWFREGTSWVSQALPPGVRGLVAIDGSSFQNIYAVGFEGTILHYDGVQWSSVDSGTRHTLRFLWAGDSKAVYITGSLDALRGNARTGFEPVFGYPTTSNGPLWVESPSSMWLAGGHGEMYRQQGGVWSRQDTGLDAEVLALSGRASDDLYAGTYSGLFHYDGTTWSVVLDSLESIADICTLPGGIVCVCDADGLYTFDGSQWTHAAATQGGSSLWASSLNDIWITTPLSLRHYDGEVLRTVYTATSGRFTFESVWGRAPDDVYAAGVGIYHYDGNAWSRVGPDGTFFHPTGNGSRVVAAWNTFALFEDGYWKTASTSGRSVVDLVTGLDNEIYMLFREGAITSIEQLQ